MISLDTDSDGNILKGRDFIVFSDDWGRHPFSCQHIMQHFLPYNRVLWVNTIGMRRPRFSIKDLRRSVQKLRSFTEKPVTENLPANLTIINPPMLPFGHRMVRELNRRSVVRAINSKISELHITSPIILVTVPNAADYLGFFKEWLTVYYCVDEFSEWPGVDKLLVNDMEVALLQKVDFVAAVSGQLVKNKISPNGPTHLLTHGVDIKHFNHAQCSSVCAPVSIAKINSPIIGYFGLIDERTDQELIETILDRHSDWNVVFIGNSVVDLTRISRHKNFYHLNAISYQNLPCYAAFFNVCLLPYVRTKLTDNINPLKLKEYLATGKPVIATALPEAVKLADYGVLVGNDYETIVQHIEAVLSGEVRDPRFQLAHLELESWDQKAALLSQWIVDALKEKSVNQ